MDPLLIANLVVGLITLSVSAIGPIISAVAFFVKHIKKSKCCGAEIELNDTKESEELLAPKNKLIDKV